MKKEINPIHIVKLVAKDKQKTSDSSYREEETYSYELKTSTIIKKFWFFKKELIKSETKELTLPAGYYFHRDIEYFRLYMDIRSKWRSKWDEIPKNEIPSPYTAEQLSKHYGYLVEDKKVYDKPMLKIIMLAGISDIEEKYDTYEEVLERLKDFSHLKFIVVKEEHHAE